MTPSRAGHRMVLHEPLIGEHEVTFAWELTPASDLYETDGFRMTFAPELDLTAVPRSLWLRLALLCLHPHFALLRPCRVEIPFYLGPAEREFWQRMVDVEALHVQRYGGEVRPGRAAELVDDGPDLRPTPIAARGARSAAAFSGGEDSLTQAGLLAELTDRPLLVTTTSPVRWARDHVGAARTRTLSMIGKRLDVELTEVHSDFRACWRNDYPASEGCTLTVNELTDVLLYQATTLAAAAAAGITRAFQASEADLQYNASGSGDVVQHGHSASSAATHAALDRLLRSYGLRLGSLTYPLHMQQVQVLLWRRYPQLADLQFSCWLAPDGLQACSECHQCLEVALVVMGEGGSPRTAGIDPVRVLAARKEPPAPGPGADRRPMLHPTRRPTDKVRRILRALPLERVAALLAADPSARDQRLVDDALAAYRRLHNDALAVEVPPDPGYLVSFLPFIDAGLRTPLRAIFAEYFAPADEQEFVRMASRARSLARWIADPLPPASAWLSTASPRHRADCAAA